MTQQTFGSPLIAPDLLARQLRMRQNMEYGQNLLNQGMQTPQGQMVSGHFVAPSPLQYIAQGLKAWTGRRTLDRLPTEAADMQRQMLGRVLGRFNLGGSVDTQPGAGVVQPSASQGSSAPDAQAFPVGPSGTPQQPPVQSQSALSPQMYAAGLRAPQGSANSPQQPIPQQMGQTPATQPMTLPGLSVEQSRSALLNLGPQEYTKLYAAQFSPTRDQRNLSFLSPDQRNRLLEGQYLQKATGDGTQRVLGADGRVYAVPVPGYAPAQATLQGGIAAAQQRAKADNTPLETVDPATGQTVYRTAGQIVRDAQTGKPAVSSRNPITQSSAIKLNDNFVTNDYQPTVTAGNAAQDMLSNINALRSIPITTGWGANAQAAAANVLTSMGMASDKVRQYASSAQAFRSIAMAQVNKVLNLAKGPQTDQDARRAQQTFASLQNTPQANAFILDYAQAAADMQARKAAYYQQMLPLAQKSGDLTRVSREWQKIQGSIWDDPVMSKWRGEK